MEQIVQRHSWTFKLKLSIQISQGSVATDMRRGGINCTYLLFGLSLNQKWNNYWKVCDVNKTFIQQQNFCLKTETKTNAYNAASNVLE